MSKRLVKQIGENGRWVLVQHPGMLESWENRSTALWVLRMLRQLYIEAKERDKDAKEQDIKANTPYKY